MPDGVHICFFSRNEDVDGDCLSEPGEKIHEFSVHVHSCVSVGFDGCRGTSNTLGAHTLVTHAPNGGLNKHYFYFPNDLWRCTLAQRLHLYVCTGRVDTCTSILASIVYYRLD